MPRPRRASTFVGQTPVCRTKVQLAVPAAGTKRRTTDRSFPASKIIRGSLRRHSVFKVQYYNAAARAANPSDGLRRSGAASRFGGPDGVLSCGRKRERIPDRTHVLVFAWTDVRTYSRMSGCTNTNILARPLASKSESEHPHTHDCRHPFTDLCRRSCLHPFTHRFTPPRLNTAENTIKYCLQRRYSTNCSDPARSSGRPERTSSKMSVRRGRRRTEPKRA